MPPIQIRAVTARSAEVPTPLLPVSPSGVPALNNSPTTPGAKTARLVCCAPPRPRRPSFGIKYEISKLRSAADILHSLVHNDGDQDQLEWVADKLLDDTHKLFDEFAKSFGKIIDTAHVQQRPPNKTDRPISADRPSLKARAFYVPHRCLRRSSVSDSKRPAGSHWRAFGTPGALDPQLNRHPEHRGWNPSHGMFALKSQGATGSCTESIFRTGCSTGRTPARFEHQFLFCPGLEPRCGYSLSCIWRSNVCRGRICEHPINRGYYVGARAGGARRALIEAFRLHGDSRKSNRPLEGAGPGISRTKYRAKLDARSHRMRDGPGFKGGFGVTPGPLRQLRAPSQRGFKQNLPGRFLTECQQIPAGRQQPDVGPALM
ncbi:hypothetical protein ACVWW4_006604 [Bradyrhizobium sp. LB7.1]